MNATPSISQAPPPSPNPIQASSPATDQTDRSNGQDFAGAMNAAGAKPARKPASKQHDAASNGSALPVAGNPPPPASALTTTAAPAAPTPSAAVNGSTAPAAASAPATSPAPPQTQAGPVNAAPTAGDQVATAPLVSAAAEQLAAANSSPPSSSIAIGSPDPSLPTATATATAPAQDARPAAATPNVATAPAGAAAPAAAITAAAAASKTDVAAATSAPTSANANSNANRTPQVQASASSAADADAAAQAAMAAAMAQGTSAPAPDSSSSSDDLATPDTGVTLQGVAAANDVASPLPSGLPAHAAAAATSASVTAATAAAIVQAVSASAVSGATDKHTRDNGPDGTVGAAQLLTSNAPSDPASGPTPTFKVSAGVDTADFGQGVADRVSLMVDSNLTSAKLQVNPPALGPIEVRIALQGGHAQVWMSSHSAVTRDALESTSPKLREMLNSQGFAQVSVDVSQRSFQERTPQPQPQAYESVSAIGGNSAPPVQASLISARSASSLLDAYA